MMHLRRAEAGRERRARKSELREYPARRCRVVVSVRISETEERQLVFEEGECLEALAARFAAEHGLGPEQLARLTRLLNERVAQH